MVSFISFVLYSLHCDLSANHHQVPVTASYRSFPPRSKCRGISLVASELHRLSTVQDAVFLSVGHAHVVIVVLLVSAATPFTTMLCRAGIDGVAVCMGGYLLLSIYYRILKDDGVKENREEMNFPEGLPLARCCGQRLTSLFICVCVRLCFSGSLSLRVS